MISGSTTTLTRLIVPTKSEMQLKVQFKVTGNYSFGIAKSVLPQAVSCRSKESFSLLLRLFAPHFVNDWLYNQIVNDQLTA